jgi:uncharacterized iron-regulated membrane protein
MKLRTVLFWIHLTAGVVAGTVILIMSVTGALLTFQQRILLTIERSQRVVQPPPGAVRLEADVLLNRVRAAMPDAQPTALTIESDPASAATIALGTAGNVFVNPYTGDVLGTGSTRARAFYRTITNWHRYLAMSGDARASGRAITGACNAAFLFLSVSGLYLWWPRKWSARNVAAVTWFRRGVRGRARDFNWHNTIGFWCAPVIVILTATAMVMSYAWANNLVYTLTGSPRPPAPSGVRSAAEQGQPGTRQRPDEVQARPPADRDRRQSATALQPLLVRAIQQLPTWRTITMRLPARDGGPVSFTLSDGAYWNNFARSTLTLNASGSLIRWEPYASSSLGQKVRGWIRFTHTGELGGFAGELVAGLACVGGSFLVWTGVMLALRRFATWRARSRGRIEGAGAGERMQSPAGTIQEI